ncbi:MAG: tetratricopeptide repeat protein [Gemmatimonadota bacterium]
MNAADRVLQPLHEAEAAVDALESYGTPDELAAALRNVRSAAERTLRLLLRESRRAPDAARLRALAPEYPVAEVITALRRGELISLELAGKLHALLAGAGRAARGDVRAADGDAAADAVVRLRAEAAAAMAGGDADPQAGSPPPVTPGEGDPAEDAAVAGRSAAGAAAGQPAGGGAARRANRAGVLSGGRLRWLAVALMLLAAVFFGAQLFRGANGAMEEGVEAFREERFGVAEQAFRAAVADDRENVTAWLYLGRIVRVQGRHDDAADALGEAAALAPGDAAVQRELGYLFLDLDQPRRAAERFDRARELDPDNIAGWVGFIRALRAADDPAADVWLGRAPAEVKAALGGTSPSTS